MEPLLLFDWDVNDRFEDESPAALFSREIT